MTVWRWIETGPADGAFHMAVDQALLENVSQLQRPAFRVYAWNPFCISLGHNQSADSIDLELCKRNSVEVVRRPTGGRAVFHSEEVTYSIIFPEGTNYFLHSLAEIYDLINRGLLRGIQKLGVPAELEKRSLDIRNHYQSKLSASCFSASAKYEIVVHGKKMVGSAQRRLSTGVLQHGSILLGRGNFALPDFLKDVKPEEKENMGRILRGKSITLEESLGRKVSFRQVVSAIKKGMTENLHVKFDKSELTEEERRRGSELEEQFSVLSFKIIEKYGQNR